MWSLKFLNFDKEKNFLETLLKWNFIWCSITLESIFLETQSKLSVKFFRFIHHRKKIVSPNFLQLLYSSVLMKKCKNDRNYHYMRPICLTNKRRQLFLFSHDRFAFQMGITMESWGHGVVQRLWIFTTINDDMLSLYTRPITENSYPQILKTSDNPIFNHHELIPWCFLSAVTFILTRSVLTAASLTGLSVRGVWRLPWFLVFRVLCFLHPLSRSCSTLWTALCFRQGDHS